MLGFLGHADNRPAAFDGVGLDHREVTRCPLRSAIACELVVVVCEGLEKDRSPVTCTRVVLEPQVAEAKLRNQSEPRPYGVPNEVKGGTPEARGVAALSGGQVP